MTGDDRLTSADVAEILRLIDTLEFSEVTLRTGDLTLTVGKHGADQLPPLPAPVPARAVAAPAPAAPAPAAEPPAPPAAADGNGRSARIRPVTTPILGTFYSRPEPGAPSFVEVGSRVEADTVVCIVEVMKMMNSIQAGVSGRVVEILGTEGGLVEAGQELFLVELDAA